MKTSVGVDGCKAGWFAVTVTDDGEWSHALYETAEAVLDRHGDAERILIDIPIGLVQGVLSELRAQGLFDARSKVQLTSICIRAFRIYGFCDGEYWEFSGMSAEV